MILSQILLYLFYFHSGYFKYNFITFQLTSIIHRTLLYSRKSGGDYRNRVRNYVAQRNELLLIYLNLSHAHAKFNSLLTFF